MNRNPNFRNLNNRGRGRGRNLRTIAIQRTVMGPPAPPRNTVSSVSAYNGSSLSRINWRNPSAGPSNSASGTGSSSRTRSSTETESRIVLALSEGRGTAMTEIGIAVINVDNPQLILCQITDTSSYINTITKINILNPSEILVPLTFVESRTSNRLLEKVQENFPYIKITGVTRSTFNKMDGWQSVKRLCALSFSSVLLILNHKYYALSSAAALVTYIESIYCVFYGKESIKIEYQECEGFALIDVSTATYLELVASTRPTIQLKYSSLLSILNRCHTRIGKRFLRASILQPPCNVSEIEERLSCVTELMENEEILQSLKIILMKLASIDQLLSLAKVIHTQTDTAADRQLNYVLIMNVLLEKISPLRDLFKNSKQPFFIELCATLSNSILDEIKELVRTLIHTDAHPASGHYGVTQRCFAVKPGVIELLDYVRKTYSERIEDMREYVKKLGEKHNLSLSLNNTTRRGYHILLSLNYRQKKSIKKSNLPQEFIQIIESPKGFAFKTLHLNVLASDVDNLAEKIIRMNSIIIGKLLTFIRERIGIFYKICEDIAKLDMLQSLALASKAIQYVRPQFSNYMEVTDSRHPLLDYIRSKRPVGNTIYASESHNMHIITGPNGSGKSIFIRQVILLQVMAQVGCYVPAKSATFRIADRILARVSLEDNMFCGVSAFTLEIKEIVFFLNVLTKNTLMIIDELGRSTSVQEGTAIAMAICKKLLKTQAFVFFTTHFKVLTKLWDTHLNVKTWQLETIPEVVNEKTKLNFTYRIIPGVTQLKNYGFFIAQAAWSADVMEYAKKVLDRLSAKHQPPTLQTQEIPQEIRLKYDLEADLKILKAQGKLTRAALTLKLSEYKQNLLRLGHQIELPPINNRNDESNFTVPLDGSPDFTFNVTNENPNLQEISNGYQFTPIDSQNLEEQNIFEPEVQLSSLSGEIYPFENSNADMQVFQMSNTSDIQAANDFTFNPALPQNLQQSAVAEDFSFNFNMQNCFRQPSPPQARLVYNLLEESSVSTTEVNFRKNIERTSTPLPAQTSALGSRQAPSAQTKSTSGSSIKWTEPQEQRMNISVVSSDTLNYNTSLCQAENATENKDERQNHVESNTHHEQNYDKTRNLDLEISEALIDLQNYSDQLFMDDWDVVDTNESVQLSQKSEQNIFGPEVQLSSLSGEIYPFGNSNADMQVFQMSNTSDIQAANDFTFNPALPQNLQQSAVAEDFSFNFNMQNCFRQPSPPQARLVHSLLAESSVSTTEANFRKNVERTSTPLPAQTSALGSRQAPSAQTKSTSGSSIKWTEPQEQRMNVSVISSDTLNYNTSLCQAENATGNKDERQNHVESNTRHEQNYDKTRSLDLEISEALIDLQNYSDQFFTDDWDVIDTNESVQLSQKSEQNRSCIEENKHGSHVEENKNNSQDEENKNNSQDEENKNNSPEGKNKNNSQDEENEDNSQDEENENNPHTSEKNKNASRTKEDENKNDVEDSRNEIYPRKNECSDVEEHQNKNHTEENRSCTEEAENISCVEEIKNQTVNNNTTIQLENQQNDSNNEDNRADNEINKSRKKTEGERHIHLFPNVIVKTIDPNSQALSDSSDDSDHPTFKKRSISNLENNEHKPKRKRLGPRAQQINNFFSETASNMDEPALEQTEIKTHSDNSASASNKSEHTADTSVNVNKKIQKFKPPRKLTKKQIKAEFDEQDRRMFEKGDISEYIRTIKNRPSVKQLQQLEVIATFKRTDSGMVPVPIKQKRPINKKIKFQTPLKKVQPTETDVTIFSDKNVKKFEEFMSSEKKSVGEFNRTYIAEQEKRTEKTENLKKTLVESAKPYHNYYLQNKTKIENICKKYLTNTQSSNSSQTSKFEEPNFDWNFDI